MKRQSGNVSVEQQTFGSVKKFRHLVLGLVFVSGISVATADSITGSYETITIDGSLSDWDAADLLYPDSQITDGTPLNTTYSNIYVANDADYLYIGLALKGPGGGDVGNDIWRRVYIDNDMDGGTGFDGGWTSGGYDRMVEYGNIGALSDLYESVGADQTAWSWNHLGPIRCAWGDNAIEWAIPMNRLGMGARTEMRLWFEVPRGGDVTVATYAHTFENHAGTYTLGADGGDGAGGTPTSEVTRTEKSVQSGEKKTLSPTIQTPAMHRSLATVDGRLRTSEIINRLTGKALQTSGPEFVITYADGQEATSDEFDLLAFEGTDAGAVARLHNSELSLTAEISYTGSKQPWAYKQIRFTNTGREPLLLRTVELEHLKVADEKVTYAVDRNFPRLSDWGQPVYTESLWFGVEFPATRSSATEDGFIFLRHHPGIEIAPGKSYQTKRAVLSASEPGHVKEAFMDYVATLPPRQEAPRMALYWCGYLVVGDAFGEGKVEPTHFERAEKQFVSLRKMKELTGFNYWSFSYDVPFYRADGLFVPVEPDTWERTRAALAPLGTRAGFWTSFSCIYTASTHDWGKTQGYELQHRRAYCLAGPKYYAAIKKRLEDIVRKYEMASINFDGMYWGQGLGCNQPGHGHLVGKGREQGVFATERVVENEFAIFESLRGIQSDILFDLFVCGEWASPWWLIHLNGVHSVHGDTVAAGIPSPWVRDELITVRDIQVFEEHRRLQRQFPLWAEDLYGTQVRANHLIDGVSITGEAYEERWEDEFVMSLPGRGTTAANLMSCDLPTLERSRGGLKFLGEVAKWTKANEAIYRDFHLIGGEPKDREVYGYSHGDGNGRAIVALRNPFIFGKAFPLALDRSLGLKPTDEKLCVNVVYPYRKTFPAVAFGDTVHIAIQDYQVLLLEVLSESRQLQGVPSAGRWSVDESGKLVLYDESILTDTPPGRLEIKPWKKALRLAGKVTVPLAADGGQIQVMFDPIAGKPVKKPVVLIDGKEVDAEFHERSGGIRQNWALIDVPPGQHQVDIDLLSLSSDDKVRMGAWFVVYYKLTGRGTDRHVPGTARLFPVFAADEDRRVTTLLEPFECRVSEHLAMGSR